MDDTEAAPTGIDVSSATVLALKEEIVRLSSRELRLYDRAGKIVLQTPLLSKNFLWTMGDEPLEVARVEIRPLAS